MESNNDKPQVLGFSQLPFSTTDSVLAFCLYLAGVPFYDERSPCINLYDSDMLAKMGFRGMGLMDAVRKAVGSRKKGHVEYAFRRTPQLDGLLRMYAEQQTELKEGEGTADKLVEQIITWMIEDKMGREEMKLRLGCVLLKMHIQFKNLWREMMPHIRVRNPGQSQIHENPDGSRRVRYPGFKIFSLNASEGTLEKLKL